METAVTKSMTREYLHSLYGNKFNSSEEMGKFLTAKDQIFQSYNGTILIKTKQNKATIQALNHERRENIVKTVHTYQCCEQAVLENRHMDGAGFAQ